MITQEAAYHTKCLSALYNRARPSAKDPQTADEDRLHGIAFAELVAFMEDINSDDFAPTFKLADLAQLYKVRLEQQGVKLDKRVHTTRLKLRLLAGFPDLKAHIRHIRGRDILLTFERDIGSAIKKHVTTTMMLWIWHVQPK